MVPELGDLTGLWRRSLIAWPDGRQDTTTAVYWLQAQSFYADLRQPADRPAFDGVTCLRQLRHGQICWLARQEGFAGELHAEDEAFEWRRQIDFQPQPAYSDVGRLRFEGDLLIEEGRDIAYVEHWRRAFPTALPCAAVRMTERHSGSIGFILRVGVIFAYARARAFALPPQRALSEQVAGAPTLQAAQDLLDCEISIGNVGAAGWVITASSLPYREGYRLAPELLVQGDGVIETHDHATGGGLMKRRWEISDVQGSLGALLMSPLAPIRA